MQLLARSPWPGGIELAQPAVAQDVGHVPVDPQFAAEMTEAAQILVAMKADRDKSETVIREVETNIKSRLREKGVKKIPGVLSWTSAR